MYIYLSCPWYVALEKSVPVFCDPQQNLFKFQLEIPLKINTALSLPHIILYYLTRRFTRPSSSQLFCNFQTDVRTYPIENRNTYKN